MKCIPQTEPVSAIRAANGPWYQSVSKVSMPRPQTSWRPVNQWAATKAAAARAESVCGKRDRRGRRRGQPRHLATSGRYALESATQPNQMPRPTASGGDDQDGGDEDAEGAQQLEQDREQRDAEDCLGEPGGCPSPSQAVDDRAAEPPRAPSESRPPRGR